jgi:hypothetical protein
MQPADAARCWSVSRIRLHMWLRARGQSTKACTLLMLGCAVGGRPMQFRLACAGLRANAHCSWTEA